MVVVRLTDGHSVCGEPLFLREDKRWEDVIQDAVYVIGGLVWTRSVVIAEVCP